ncbi:MAG: hypothetical protein H6765_06555 [Candidatus Peribacteria bacterium]|nr:MAG: hypothetical protein H6765_06555 [Candidatus Peribacteria bacterium]
MNDTINNEFLEEVKQLLPADQIDAFVAACQRPLKKSITLNPFKMHREDFIKLVTQRGWTLTPNPFTKEPNTYYIDREHLEIALGNSFLHQCGYFYIQEIAASMPANLLDLKP